MRSFSQQRRKRKMASHVRYRRWKYTGLYLLLQLALFVSTWAVEDAFRADNYALISEGEVSFFSTGLVGYWSDHSAPRTQRGTQGASKFTLGHPHMQKKASMIAQPTYERRTPRTRGARKRPLPTCARPASDNTFQMGEAA